MVFQVPAAMFRVNWWEGSQNLESQKICKFVLWAKMRLASPQFQGELVVAGKRGGQGSQLSCSKLTF